LKWRVTWWIHASGQLNGGSDIIETDDPDCFPEDVAEKLIELDLARTLGDHVGTKYSFPYKFEPSMPNFVKKYIDLSNAARHSEISNWGIRCVKALKMKTHPYKALETTQ